MRGRNIGIWNDVFLTSTGKVTVQDPYVQTQLVLPDTTQARLTAEVVVKNHDGKEVSGVLSGRVGDVTFEQPVQLKAGEERTVVFDADRFPQLQVKNPRLWWPNVCGGPTVTVHLICMMQTLRSRWVRKYPMPATSRWVSAR